MAKYRVQVECDVVCKKIDTAKLAKMIADEWYIDEPLTTELCDHDDESDYCLKVRYSKGTVRVKEITNA